MKDKLLVKLALVTMIITLPKLYINSSPQPEKREEIENILGNLFGGDYEEKATLPELTDYLLEDLFPSIIQLDEMGYGRKELYKRREELYESEISMNLKKLGYLKKKEDLRGHWYIIELERMYKEPRQYKFVKLDFNLKEYSYIKENFPKDLSRYLENPQLEIIENPFEGENNSYLISFYN